MYDLDRDPDERDDLAGRQPELSRELTAVPGATRGESVGFASSEREALRALGYPAE